MTFKVMPEENICWEALHIRLILERSLNNDEIKELGKIIDSWYTLGVYKAFSGALHYMSDLTIEENEVGFTVDMGSVDESALNYLIQALEGFSEVFGVIIDKIILYKFH